MDLIDGVAENTDSGTSKAIINFSSSDGRILAMQLIVQPIEKLIRSVNDVGRMRETLTGQKQVVFNIVVRGKERSEFPIFCRRQIVKMEVSFKGTENAGHENDTTP
jgi:hypothetical protein